MPDEPRSLTELYLRAALLLCLTAYVTLRSYHAQRALDAPREAPGAASPAERLLRALTATAAGGLGLVHAFTAALPFARLPLSTAVRLLGLALAALSLALLAWCDHSRAHAPGEVPAGALRASTWLGQRGPYRWLRFPQATATGGFLIGLGLLAASWLLLAASLAPYALLVALRVRREERLMLGQGEDAYRRYARRTWRLLPYVF